MNRSKIITLYVSGSAAILIAVVMIVWMSSSPSGSAKDDRPRLFNSFEQLQRFYNTIFASYASILMEDIDDVCYFYEVLEQSYDKKLSVDMFLFSVVNFRQGELDQAVEYANAALSYYGENIQLVLYGIFLFSCVEDMAESASIMAEHLLDKTERGDFPNNALRLFFADEEPLYHSNDVDDRYLEMYEFIDWMKEYMQMYNWSVKIKLQGL